MNLNILKRFISATSIVLLTILSVSASENDDRIESSAQQSYVFKTYLKDDAIKTKSNDGNVTLTGTVASESHKLLAEETVANLPGVKSVDNKLESKVEIETEKSDDWISIKVTTYLLFKRNVSGFSTKVSVKDGIVTLKGEAANQGEKDLTAEYVKDIEGVKDVKNEMTIAPVKVEPKQTFGEKIDDASITAQIKIALLWHRSTSSFKTGVETNNGVVTLTGETNNEAGKDMASKIANDVKGVKEVINNMTI